VVEMVLLQHRMQVEQVVVVVVFLTPALQDMVEEVAIPLQHL
tara:strand:+ start:380 stop:505 length:126 start_codon:yes stop_codon:yes gene_type:complete